MDTDQRQAVGERVARFMRLNYVAGTTNVPWSKEDPDLKDVWLIEADHIVDLVLGREPEASFSIDQRCGCGKHPDHEPVRYHRRGSSGCRADSEAP